jgi:tetratricopeptide (TPR) repeat protein
VAETIWAKTEEYLHNGIGKGLDEPGSNCGEQHDERHHHTQHEDDWKGPLRNLARQMRPWADHHLEHAPTEELLPWFRVIAWCNPHFVQVYVDGAYILSWESKRPREAVEFLRQGLRLNPEAIQLYTALGDLYLYNLKKGREAYPYYVAAYEIGRRLRNPSEDENLAYRDAFRGLVFVYRQFGNKEWERRLAAEGLEHFPGDKVLAEVH